MKKARAAGEPEAVEATARRRRRDGPKKDPRQELLRATIDYVGEHGTADLTLRQLAAAIGTSHRMLGYHFESKENLLAAVVHAVESRISETLKAMDERADLPPADEIRQIWDHITSPLMLTYGRLYVEMFAQALRGRAPALFEGLDRYWNEALTKVSLSTGRSLQEAQIEGRLALGVLRGLYLDLLANNDREGVRKAWDSFLARYEQPAAKRRPEKARTKPAPKAPASRGRSSARP
ncbi:TetR/AcrR family transcriptional regulator [Inquilinus sp. OTU3971]|uniref:TetR/AcrR family transcriptional regulator n=1 Tax=Inquilinus sp. OTU3971 TaxID=3043855 RepID=UPI00313E9EA9